MPKKLRIGKNRGKERKEGEGVPACTCVYVCTRMCVRMRAYVCVRVCVRMRAYVCVRCVRMCAYVHMCACYVWAWNESIFIYNNICIIFIVLGHCVGRPST